MPIPTPKMTPPQIPKPVQTSLRTPSFPKADKYAQDYHEALAFLANDQFEECIKTAKLNLTDPTLPRYHRIKTHLLIAHVSSDWLIAERHRRRAEEIFRDAKELTKDHESAEIAALEGLRGELDELARAQGEELGRYEREFGKVRFEGRDFRLVGDGDGEERGDPVWEDVEGVERAERELWGEGRNPWGQKGLVEREVS